MPKVPGGKEESSTEGEQACAPALSSFWAQLSRFSFPLQLMERATAPASLSASDHEALLQPFDFSALPAELQEAVAEKLSPEGLAMFSMTSKHSNGAASL